MKKVFNTISRFNILTLLFLTSCRYTTQAPPNKLTVLTSTSFLADIAQNIAGDRVQVDSLLPVGTYPHAYQAKPSNIAKIAESDLLILNGLEYELFIESLLEDASEERIIIEATAGIRVQEEHAETIADSVCEQISENSYEINSGIDAVSAVLLETGEEHSHTRDIFNVKLNLQADGSYAGYLFFDANAKEEKYVFTSPKGSITVYSLGNIALVSQGEFDIDCSNMSHAISYNLFAGRYIVELSGFDTEVISFSATSIHLGEAEKHEGDDLADEAESNEGHEHETGDAHMWLNPNLVIKYVENIRDGFIQVDPDGKEVYKQNAETYISLKTKCHNL